MNVQKTTEFLPKATGEFGVPVQDDGGGHSMKAKNVVEKYPGDL